MISNNKTVDLLQNISLQDAVLLGKSICILAKFSQEKLPIPSGFVVSVLGFNQYLDLTDLRQYYEKSRSEDDRNDLIQVLSGTSLPGSLQNEINSAYSKISGFTDAYVNIRALILNKDSEEISHTSYTAHDVKGEQEVVTAIEDLYREILNDNIKTIDSFFSGDLKITVIIQKAIQSEASGMMFTTDAVTKDNNKLIIEAVYGLESGTAMEGIVPDQYTFDKNSGEVSEKHISSQEFMIVRQMGSANATQKVVISPAWQKRQKLDDKHIVVLAKTGQIIEEELQEPQQISWSYESGKIWINFIESLDKKKYQSESKEKALQHKVDTLIKEPKTDGTDLNVHIPEAVLQDKNILVDLVLEENKDIKKDKKTDKTALKNKDMNNKTETNSLNKEPLLEGMHSAGTEAQGEITFEPESANVNHILVLKGDEDISSTLKVSGFIIEDESEILADRLFEYFKVPVITGVALARKILKQGERVVINGKNAHIYELVPYNTQANEIEMSIVKKQDEKVDQANFTFPIKQQENIEIQAELSPNQMREPEVKEIEATNEVEVETSTQEPIINTPKMVEGESVLGNESNIYEDQKVRIEKRPQFVATNSIPQVPVSSNEIVSETKEEKKDLSRLLNLVSDENEVLKVEEKELSKKSVEGVSKDDQLKVWGKSLDKIISASKKVSPAVAVGALEHVIEDTNNIEQNSKEYTFDNEERYIAQITQSHPKPKLSPFIPTATKVYVQLIDEDLDKDLENYDGVVLASTFEPEAIMEQIENTLEKANSKEVLVICPPYEENALVKFFEGIYDLRNKGYRNLSVILPDYRNKKEISEVKKLLTVSGLRRSSTFEILANISRTINVFRISELEEGTTDGVYVDLFRLKMNMLGVDKLTASTKYVEGMKNLVSYIHENLKIDGKTLVNISAFESPKKVVQHLFKFGFWGVVCEQGIVDEVKKYISKVEQSSILENKSSRTKKSRKSKR